MAILAIFRGARKCAHLSFLIQVSYIFCNKKTRFSNTPKPFTDEKVTSKTEKIRIFWKVFGTWELVEKVEKSHFFQYSFQRKWQDGVNSKKSGFFCALFWNSFEKSCWKLWEVFERPLKRWSHPKTKKHWNENGWEKWENEKLQLLWKTRNFRFF
jgi:hypothetical protein